MLLLVELACVHSLHDLVELVHAITIVIVASCVCT